MKYKYKKSTLFRDAFVHFNFIKRFLIFTFGCLSYKRYNGFNQLSLKGTEYIQNLPKNQVLFVSNHQTYFADVFAMFHVFCSVKNGFLNTIKNPIYLLNPIMNLYFVAAKKTMNHGILTKLFNYSGGITVNRSWITENNKKQYIDLSEIYRMGIALNDGWLITFPQGTTKACAPVRRGIVHVIKKYNPIVVPIVIDGFYIKLMIKKELKLNKKELYKK
ncbi:lysophospholipid acyltransferase family protein [Blattabacterium cuenoti]|uniref:lysophospholipid acyltransferase family protein n=1 Tax=Blattabacterium cuenoti TaxID=1653831 RepID=UPI00293BCA59|nr:1-acyl-sn-glycerol-3-phosphate acyltransferase [Blattabacterium cuenoti]